MRATSLTLTCLLLLPLAASGQAEESPEALPGYVDFDGLRLFEGREASVEISLKGVMLELLSGVLRSEEPGLGDLISRIRAVEVRVYNDLQEAEADFRENVSDLARRLEGDSWERVVRVRDEGESIHVYLKHLDQVIQGLVVMALDEKNEGVFINIVGDIDPEEIGRLGETLDIRPLERIRIDQRRRAEEDESDED